MHPWDWIQQITIKGIVENVAANVVWTILGGGLVFLINIYRNDSSKFVGKWEVTVHWSPAWAKTLFETTEEVGDPKSVGEISLSSGSGRKRSQYWGLGFFRLHSGDTVYGLIAVKVYDVITSRPWFQSDFPYIKALRLERFSIVTLVRRPVVEPFKYATQRSYYMEMEKSSEDRIKGVMKMRGYEKDEVVGIFVGDRIL